MIIVKDQSRGEEPSATRGQSAPEGATPRQPWSSLAAVARRGGARRLERGPSGVGPGTQQARLGSHGLPASQGGRQQ